MLMRIKPVQNGDLIHLSRIEKELFKEDAFGVFLLFHYLQNHLLFQKIIDDSDEIIGFGIISQFNPALLNPHEMEYVDTLLKNKKKIAHLVDFAIRTQYWNQGYGTILLHQFITTLIEKGYDFLYLEVDSSNSRAFQFYKKCEFEEIGIIQSYYSTGHDAILMLKSLERFS
ncbi:MAG: GNAT family N-acetyltransferase [Promethearchaeota archaeon]|nr:MAG: GNAT family N-acetyltransferase [Candidatus Lokiarchaeota archaeon]